jgi:hypothetical protein
MYVKETGWDGARCIIPSQEKEEWRALVNTVMNNQVIKIQRFLFLDSRKVLLEGVNYLGKKSKIRWKLSLEFMINPKSQYTRKTKD